MADQIEEEIQKEVKAHKILVYGKGTKQMPMCGFTRETIQFFDKYRSYVINYNLGQDLVRAYVEREAGPDPDRRWDVFAELLASPTLPSSLADPDA